MPLFVAIHRHVPGRCPAGDPSMGPALPGHLSHDHAAKSGVTLQAETVADDQHTPYLIAQAGDDGRLRRHLAPFAQAGSAEVLPASPARRSSAGVAARRDRPDKPQISGWPLVPAVAPDRF